MDPIDMMVTDYNCEDLGLSRLCLMESAGKSLADEIAKIAIFTFSKPVKIAIFTGSGGNGGDGFVAARHLLNRGYEVDIYLVSNNVKSEIAKKNFDILNNLKPKFSRLNIKEFDDNCEVAKTDSFSDFIVIDAILGTGVKGNLRSNVKKAINVINESNGLTISVDVPSGLNPLTGEISDIAVKPDYTVSFHKIKTGVRLAGEDLVGGLVTCDIGIPIEAELFVGSGDLLKLKKRDENSHKGNNGKVLIVGGSKDYYGAPVISALTSFSCGADLVYISSPVGETIKKFSPDFIVKSLEGDYLNLSHVDDILELVNKVDAVLIGPGSSVNEETSKLFNILVHKIDKPLVLDADALKLVDLSLIKNKENLIITPHLFEFNSFYDTKIDIEDIDGIQKIAKSIKGVTILKGKNDLILQNNRFKINKTGNPGMTVGGTGDALAGICVSLLSQGLNVFDASCIATYLNGKAGDMALKNQGIGFTASDLTYYLSLLMGEI